MKHIGIRVEEGKIHNGFQADQNVVWMAPEKEQWALVGGVEDAEGNHLDVIYAKTLDTLVGLAAKVR